MREYTLTHELKTPVSFIVHSLQDVNDQLAKGRPFFSDIARDGIMLFEAEGHPLAKAKALSPAEIKAEAKGYFIQWMDRAIKFQAGAKFYSEMPDAKLTAFNLHQAVEALYHCVLLVFTLYSPKSHRLSFLRSQAEGLDERLRSIWPDDNKFARRCFAKLQRAYVEARYSSEYEITDEELEWLSDRVEALRGVANEICLRIVGPLS